MRICFETAEEMGNALLDAVELGRQTGQEVVISSTLNNKWLAFVGDPDSGTRFRVDPPIEKPDTPYLRVAS